MRTTPSEAQIQSAVIEHWRTFARDHTLVAAIPNARAFGQAGLTRGLFDLLCLGGSVGVGFLELKTDKGKPSAEQERFASLCEHHMLHHRITYGRDEPIRVLEEWGIVRRQVASDAPASQQTRRRAA